FVAFGTENVQAADGRDFVVLFIGLRLVAVECLSPFIGRNRVFIAVVVEDRNRAIFLRPFDLALSHAQLLRDSLLHQFLLGHEFGISAEQDVGAATGHVGGDGDHAFASRLGHVLGLALVELGVQNNVLLKAFFL